MFVEAMILDGHNRIFHGLRNLIGLDWVTALVKQVGHVVALRITDGCYPRDIACFQCLNVRFHGVGGGGNRYARQTRYGRQSDSNEQANDEGDQRDSS